MGGFSSRLPQTLRWIKTMPVPCFFIHQNRMALKDILVLAFADRRGCCGGIR
jgi:hypothetical protein